MENMGRDPEPAKKRLADMRVLIVGGNNAACALPDLLRFLTDGPRAEDVIFVGHPFPEDFVRRSEVQVRRGGRQREWSIKRGQHHGLLSWLGDIFATLLALLILRRAYDLYVASSLHLVLLGLVLESVGIVKCTVCWTHDYHPRRFGNSFLNSAHLKLDEFCVKHVDYCWDVVPTIAEHRHQRGIKLAPHKVLTVGDPVPAEQMDLIPAEEVPAASIINSGAVEEAGYGFNLLLEALPHVIRKEPKTKVTVTTYKGFPENLRHRIRELGLEAHFSLRGYIADELEYVRVVQRHRVGLAIYEPIPNTHKRYSDSRAKVYAAQGVPVIITRVSPIAAEIEAAGAGIVIDHEKEQLAEAILKLLTDDDFYRRCRDNAINLAQQYLADKVFPAAFRRMGIES